MYMEDYKQKYLIYKKKYIMLKLGGSINKTDIILIRNKLLGEINVSNFFKKYTNLNFLLLNNSNKIEIQTSSKNIYNEVGPKNIFWNNLPVKIKIFLKESRNQEYQNIENFMIRTTLVNKIKYLVNELDVFNNIILYELKRIYLTELENKLSQEKNSYEKKQIKREIKQISESTVGGVISKIDEQTEKVSPEQTLKIKDIIKLTESEVPGKKIKWEVVKSSPSSVWNDADKIILGIDSKEKPKQKQKLFIPLESNIKDFCNPYFINDNMSLYTNDYLEKYLLRTKIKSKQEIINPHDVLLSTIIRNKSALVFIKENEYEYLGFKIKINKINNELNKTKTPQIDKWNSINPIAKKWIQSLRQIDELKNYNGFIKYIIQDKLVNTDISIVNELLLTNIYGYINAKKSSVPGECSICSLYNEITSCSIPNKHMTFNKDVFCVLLKYNEVTDKLELPQKINKDQEDNEFDIEGAYYFITKSNYTNLDEYIVSFNYFDKVFGEELLNYCLIQDKLQQKYISKKIKNERKISNNIDVEKSKIENNKFDKKFNESKRLSNRIGSISSLVNVGKFITKNLLLTSCSCPFIINNVDASVKMLQEINYNSISKYTDDEYTFRK